MRKSPSKITKSQPSTPSAAQPTADGINVEKPVTGPIELTAKPEALASMGGSRNEHFNMLILREALATIWVPGGEKDEDTKRVRAVIAALGAINPRDELEGMLAAQTVALHFGAMECFRRTMLREQPAEIASKLRRDGANLARTMVEMLDALDRKRGKRPQVVRVERVVVQDGGQAIVGAVATDRGEA